MKTKKEKLVVVEIKNDKMLISENWVIENNVDEYIDFFKTLVNCCRIRYKIIKTNWVVTNESKNFVTAWTKEGFKTFCVE